MTVSAAFTVTAVASIATAQAPTPPTGGARLTYEVASIKRNVSGDPNTSIRVQPGGQLVVTNNSLFNLIRNAYGTQRYEMVPGERLPAWTDSDRTDKRGLSGPFDLDLRWTPDQPGTGPPATTAAH
jgi:hypothetical protein